MNGETNVRGVGVPRGRIVPAICAAIGAGLLAINHFSAARDGAIWIFILFLAPMFTLLGLGGLVDPRILWSIGPRGKLLPKGVRLLGAGLAVAGIAVSAALILLVYRLQI